MTDGKQRETMASPKIREDDEKDNDITYFYGATTLPIRKGGTNYSGKKYNREALSKKALDNIAEMINDNSRLGGDRGSYRTISLFHDRVYAKDSTREEAGFVSSDAKAVVEPLEKYPGHYGVKVGTKVNKMYIPPPEFPDYTPEKISYKIDNGAMGLSLEYDNTPAQEYIVDIDGETINVIDEITDFRGFGYARPNMIADPASVKIQELGKIINNNSKGEKMEQKEYEAKLREVEEAKEKVEAKLEEAKKESEEAKKDAEVSAEDKQEAEAKVQELEARYKDAEGKVRELKISNNEMATKIRESIQLAFDSVKIKEPPKNISAEKLFGKAREMRESVEKSEWGKYREICDEEVKVRESILENQFKKGGVKGFDWDENATLKVRCKGRGFEVVATEKTRELVESYGKTRDTIDANSMAESNLYQTNAMFADRYVQGITETFLMDDTLLKAMMKVPHIGGNDFYQWKIWVDFGTFTGTNTAAVDPNTTSVSTTERKFIKLQTPLREYRDAVEVTDWTRAHSAGVVALMDEEVNRAAEYVVNSMDADLFKPYGDATTGWVGFNGLLYIADSASYTTYGGKTRSAANMTLDSTTANTYVSTSESISVDVVRNGYEKVLAHGSSLGELAIVTSPTQTRRLFNSEDAAIRYKTGELSYAGAPPSWGFNRAMIPYLDGIPILRDYYCTDVSGNFDTFAVVDLGKDGFVLSVSKSLGMTNLAKVGTSEKAYVSFWGQSVYKRPRNVFLHDTLILT